MHKLYCIILISFFSLVQTTHAQYRRADSLKAVNEYVIARDNTYSNPSLGKTHAQESVRLAKLAKCPQVEATASNILGLCHRNLGEYKPAITAFTNASNIHRKRKDRTGYGQTENNIAITWFYLGDVEKAHGMLLEVIKEAEEHKLFSVLANAYQNMGLINDSQKRYMDALENFRLAEKYHGLSGNPRGESGALMNQGAIYSKHLQDYDKAIAIYNKVIPIKEKVRDDKGVGIAYNNLSEIYFKQGNHQLAVETVTKAIAIRQKVNDQLGLILSNGILAKIYLAQEKYADAEKHALIATETAQKIGAKKELADHLILLATVQEASNNIADAYSNFVKSTNMRDTLLNRENFARMAELEARYQNEKKEKLIAENNIKLLQAETEMQENEKLIAQKKAELAEAEAETGQKEKQLAEDRLKLLKTEAESGRRGKLIAENQIKIDRQHLTILGITALAIIVTLTVFIFYSRQKLKTIRLEKEAELREALRLIETQNQLQQQRLQISRDLHDNIGSQLTFIISSLDNLKYGFEIPTGLQGRLSGIHTFTKDTITELRDTIWAMNKDEISLLDLRTRISNFIEKAKTASKGIQFDFTTDSSIADSTSFSSLKGINLYRMIQEGINNALKHSDATMINVDISKSHNGYTICIKDNGNGFDTANINPGNGLANIKKRVAEIGGELAVITETGVGTEIIIHMK